VEWSLSPPVQKKYGHVPAYDSRPCLLHILGFISISIYSKVPCTLKIYLDSTRQTIYSQCQTIKDSRRDSRGGSWSVNWQILQTVLDVGLRSYQPPWYLLPSDKTLIATIHVYSPTNGSIHADRINNIKDRQRTEIYKSNTGLTIVDVRVPDVLKFESVFISFTNCSLCIWSEAIVFFFVFFSLYWALSRFNLVMIVFGHISWL